MYDIPLRLGEHPNLVRFEKRAVKTLQHGQIYGDVFLFHEMTNTYEWWSAIIDTNYIFVANYYAFPVHIGFFGQIRYLNIRHERTLTSIPLMLKWSERCRETQEREPAHTGWCLVMQPQKIPRYFEIGSQQNWFTSLFLQRWSLWCSAVSFGYISFITFWLFVCITSFYLSLTVILTSHFFNITYFRQQQQQN